MIDKKYFVAARTPDSKKAISDSWLISRLQSFFKNEKNKHYGIQGVQLQSVEVSRRDGKLQPDTNLSLLVGLDKEKGEVEVQFLHNCCFAASIKAKVA